MADSQTYLVLVTAPSGDAERIARSIVEERLAACVSVVRGLRSIYWWEGKIEESGEDLLLIKTRSDALEDLVNAIKRIHPYEVPEIIAVPIVGGLREYLEWVVGEVRPRGSSSGP